jgi:O-antigen ligase
VQYVAGLDLFAEHPLFGVGAGNFMFYAQSYGLSKSLRMHSLYIALLAETGIVGTVLYLGAVLTGLARGATLLSARVVEQQLVFAVGCGLVGVLAAGMWGPFLDSLPRVLPLWALMGALVGSARIAYDR